MKAVKIKGIRTSPVESIIVIIIIVSIGGFLVLKGEEVPTPVSPNQNEWVYVTTFTAMTDYWHSTWLDLLSEPWNRLPDNSIDNYYLREEQFTDYFYIQGNKFKIEYHVAGDNEYGTALVFTYPKGTDVLHVDAKNIPTPNALAEGTYTVDEGPGYYYCVVGTDHIDYWTIDIYDWR
ncbi:MAG: hypothetical protein AVW06_03585 [Hadesarchaea archaeon DG-33-1]|nr:MAG: hypothetical protein AVW06_03585 [Hadesarchaea archaeon DG-33-1]